MAKNKKNFLTKSAILKRGWTEGLINFYLPEPDVTKPNPMYRKAAPMNLYSKTKVENIEKRKNFQQSQDKLINRKIGAQVAIETKTHKMKEYVDNLQVELEDIPLEQARLHAIDSYNDFHSVIRNNDLNWASTNSDVSFLNRITVNFLRHQASNYEEELENIFGKVGKLLGYTTIKNKILTAIKSKYPALSAECNKQLAILE